MNPETEGEQSLDAQTAWVLLHSSYVTLSKLPPLSEPWCYLLQSVDNL